MYNTTAKKAVFLDRDGVILSLQENNSRGSVYQKSQVIILPGVSQALSDLKNENYFLFVVSNQSVVADGLASYAEVIDIHNFINALLDKKIDKFYFCPHHPKQRDDVPDWAKVYRIECDCRKPDPGLLIQATKDFNIDLKSSWLIGDMVSDISAGAAVGCKTILVESPHSNKVITTSKPFDINIKPDLRAKDLGEATQLILTSIKL